VLVPDARVQRFLRQMRRPIDERVTGDTARELCKQAGGRATIETTIAPSGSSYAISLDARDCLTGKSWPRRRVRPPARATSWRNSAPAIKALRKDLGETAATREKYDADLAKATSANLEALQAYGLGLKARVIRGEDAAAPLFAQAATLDPAFGSAYAKLAVVLSNVGDIAGGRDQTVKAYALRDQMTEYERLYIIWNHAAPRCR
jgi:hypothetical protein